MQALVEQGMQDGAFGLSTGLFYVPGTFTPTDGGDRAREGGRPLRRHARVASARRRGEAARQRERDDRDRREGGICRRRSATPRSSARPTGAGASTCCALVDEARARGVDVTIDQYPYTASSTSVAAALMPAWALEGGRAGHAGAPEGLRRAREKAKADIVDDDPRRARRRRSEERAVRQLRLRRVARRQDARRSHQRSAAWRRRSRNAAEVDDVDRRAGRLPGHLPRDERATIWCASCGIRRR